MTKKIFTALVTPFTKSGQVDYKSLTKLLYYQSGSLVDGIVVLGSTAEEKLLSTKEKTNIINLAIKIAQNKQIIVGINEISVKSVQSVLKTYNKYNIDGYLISPPCYLKLNQTEIYNFYRQIAQMSKHPIIVYNIPSRTGSTISPQTITKLSKIKKIVALKDALCDFSALRYIKTHAKQGFSVLCGNDDVFTKHKRAYSGAISVVTNILPNLLSACKNSQQINKLAQTITAKLCQFQNPAAIKYLMSKNGIINNILRPPLSPIQSNKSLNSINLHIKWYIQ